MTSPLLFRSSLWVNFFAIGIIVAPVLQWIFGLQKRLPQASRQAAWRGAGQNAEEGAARRNPCKRALEDGDAQVPVEQVANRKSREGSIRGQIGAKQGCGGANAFH